MQIKTLEGYLYFKKGEKAIVISNLLAKEQSREQVRNLINHAYRSYKIFSLTLSEHNQLKRKFSSRLRSIQPPVRRNDINLITKAGRFTATGSCLFIYNVFFMPTVCPIFRPE